MSYWYNRNRYNRRIAINGVVIKSHAEVVQEARDHTRLESGLCPVCGQRLRVLQAVYCPHCSFEVDLISDL